MTKLPLDYATDVTALTLERYLPKMMDNISKGSPLYAFLSMNGRVTVQGGKSITIPLRYANNPNMGSYAKGGDLALDRHQEFTAANYPWRYVYANVVIESTDVYENMGDLAMQDLVDSKIAATETGLMELFNTFFLSTATAAPATDLFGLGYLINDDEDVAVGGITPDQADVDTRFWKAIRPEDRPANFDNAGLRKHLHDLHAQASVNQQYAPDLMLTNRGMYVEISDRAWDKAQIDVGGPPIEVPFLFKAFMFADALVMWDNNFTAPAGKTNPVAILNTDTIELVCHENRWMQKEDSLREPEKDQSVTPIFSMGNLVCGARRANALEYQATQ